MERKELPWQPAQKLELLNRWAAAGAHFAAPDAFAHGHHGDGGVVDASGPKARLKGQYSHVIQAEPMAHDLNPVLLPARASAQQPFHDAEDAGPLPVRLQNKPAARALARRPLPLQTFYVVSACLASIYACVAL